jgi:hypothetical protein
MRRNLANRLFFHVPCWLNLKTCLFSAIIRHDFFFIKISPLIVKFPQTTIPFCKYKKPLPQKSQTKLRINQSLFLLPEEKFYTDQLIRHCLTAACVVNDESQAYLAPNRKKRVIFQAFLAFFFFGGVST